MRKKFFGKKEGWGVGREEEEKFKEPETYKSKCVNPDPLEMIFRKFLKERIMEG